MQYFNLNLGSKLNRMYLNLFKIKASNYNRLLKWSDILRHANKAITDQWQSIKKRLCLLRLPHPAQRHRRRRCHSSNDPAQKTACRPQSHSTPSPSSWNWWRSGRSCFRRPTETKRITPKHLGLIWAVVLEWFYHQMQTHICSPLWLCDL